MTTDETTEVSALRAQLASAERRAESLRRVIELISSELALEPLLTLLVASATELIDADYGSIGLVIDTPAGALIRTAAIFNMPTAELGAEIRAGVGLAGLVLDERRPIILARYGDLQRPTLPDLADHTVIGMPIWWGGHMIGFLGIGADPPRRFGEQDSETLALVARHAAIAIENARLFAAEQRRAARRAAINQIGRLITSRLSLDELLQTVVSAIHDKLDYANIAILLVDSDTPEQLVLRARGGVYMQVGEYRQALYDGIIGAAAHQRQAVLIPDVWRDPRYIGVPGETSTRAELAVPILVGERLLGVLNIESAEPISTEDAESAETIADQLGVAIQNAQLFEAEQRRSARVAIINRIGRLITGSLSLDQIFQIAAESVRQQLDFSHVGIGIVDPLDPQLIQLVSQAGVFVERIPIGLRQSIDIGLIGYAARMRETVLINNVSADPRYYQALADQHIHAELVVPIAIGERLLGVINIESMRPISADDAAGVEIIADQLGIAMDNARRYEEERRRTARLELIARVGQRIAARLDPDELVTITVEELRHQMGYDHVALFLIDEDQPAWLVQHACASRWMPDQASGYRQQITQGVLGAAATERRYQLVNDIANDPRYIAVTDADPIKAELAMPITVGARLLGVLDVAGVHRFSDDDVASVRVIADQIGIAIDHARLFMRTQRALDETRLLYETSQRMGVAMSPVALVQAYLEQVAARGRYNCTVIVYDLDINGRRTNAAIRGFWSAAAGLHLKTEPYPYRRDTLDHWLDAGETLIMADVFSDPRASQRLRDTQRYDNRPALAFIPLMVGPWRIGLVVLSYHQVHHWPAAELDPYRATATMLAAAIATRQQEVQVAEQRQQVAVLEERRRLARELHDSVTQSLFSMSLLAQVLPDLWQIDQEAAREALDQIRDQTRGALAEMRALLFELRPAALGEQDLGFALREHANIFAQRTGITVSVDAPSKCDLPNAVEQAFFRIAQEALANVARHAHARSVRLTLLLGPLTQLQISDDGQGFQPEQVGAGRFGLTSMRERASQIGARVELHSQPGRGTDIIVEWPGPQATA